MMAKFVRGFIIGAIAGFIIFAIAGCSAEKRLARLIRKHPHLVDTSIVIRMDTIRTQQITTDTIFENVGQVDTLIVDNDTVKTIVIRNHDQFRVKTIVRPIEVVRRDTISIRTIRNIPAKSKSVPWGLIAALLMIYTLAILYFARKK